MVGLSYGARNVLSYTRRMVQNFLAYHPIKTLPPNLLVSYPLVLLDGLVASEPRDLRQRVRLEEALHDEVVALLPDRRLLGEARWNAVGNAWFAAEIIA